MAKICPCGSKLTYELCCSLYITAQQFAPTPEKLMRSRYTAYTLANIDYIKKTMRGKALIGFDEFAAKQWAEQVEWIGLEIINAMPHATDTSKGTVEFIAKYNHQGKLKGIHERSEFQYSAGKWYYIDGFKPLIRKTARNAACPCGSLKKYKNCHGRTTN